MDVSVKTSYFVCKMLSLLLLLELLDTMRMLVLFNFLSVMHCALRYQYIDMKTDCSTTFVSELIDSRPVITRIGQLE